MSQPKQFQLGAVLRGMCLAFAGLPVCVALSGCMVAGYSSGGGSGGGFIWPGGLGLVFVLLVVLWFLLRRR